MINNLLTNPTPEGSYICNLGINLTTNQTPEGSNIYNYG